MTAEELTPWCPDCERVSVDAGESACFRCLPRRAAGLPPLVEKAREEEQKQKSRFVHYRGAYNAEIP